MTAPDGKFSTLRRRPRPGLIVLIALLHIGLFYGLLRALAPGAIETVESSVVSAFTVSVTVPEEPPPPDPRPDEGAAGDPGEEAIPQPVTAPTPRQTLRRDEPAPRVASTGTAPTSGAAQAGQGTGAAGRGEGPGSGGEGSGRGGGVPVTDPVKIAGDINSAADFPIPEGGRQARFGTSVTVAMTVGVDGRASDCRVIRPSPDPVADRIVCQLAVERFRFRPARDANGEPVPAPYGWRQEWFAR